MESIVVRGGRRLSGSVRVEGAKNAALPLLAATLLAGEGRCELRNVPPLTDVLLMVHLLRHARATVHYDARRRHLTVHAGGELRSDAGAEAGQLRASVLLLAPLLVRCGRARLPAPGGCRIGARPLLLHAAGLRALGAAVTLGAGHVEAAAGGLRGARVVLAFPSVGATQNVMMAAVRAEGTTVIENAAREPEIVDLATFLCKMGARIEGAGSETIVVVGVRRLRGAEHAVMQDRIEAGTFLIAGAMTRGDVLVRGAEERHHAALAGALRAAGARLRQEAGGLRVLGPRHLRPVRVRTEPYPGFPTDLQAPLCALLLHARGTSALTETLYEDRFRHLHEMRKLGARVSVDGDVAYLHGGGALRGGAVCAEDLRGGAALLLAGLRARTRTELSGLQHLDRGYYRIHRKLRALGADVRRLRTPHTPHTTPDTHGPSDTSPSDTSSDSDSDMS